MKIIKIHTFFAKQMVLMPLKVFQKGLKPSLIVSKQGGTPYLIMLLSPPEESQMMDGTKDDEICQDMLAVCKDEGESGDVRVEDLGDMSVEPIPTYAKVFQVVSIINRYIGQVGDPAVHTFEADLVSFVQKMRSEMSTEDRIISTHISNQCCH